eukprot:1154028-Pelagomonas_calceolata.AAC.8
MAAHAEARIKTMVTEGRQRAQKGDLTGRYGMGITAAHGGPCRGMHRVRVSHGLHCHSCHKSWWPMQRHPGRSRQGATRLGTVSVQKHALERCWLRAGMACRK